LDTVISMLRYLDINSYTHIYLLVELICTDGGVDIFIFVSIFTVIHDNFCVYYMQKEISAGFGCCPVKDGKSGTFSLRSDDDWSAILNASTLTFVRFTASWYI
jgi:hypothetical protein